jgi:hypothetical protein
VTIKFLHCGDGMSVGERFRLPGIAALDHGGKGRRQAAGITGSYSAKRAGSAPRMARSMSTSSC